MLNNVWIDFFIIFNSNDSKPVPDPFNDWKKYHQIDYKMIIKLNHVFSIKTSILPAKKETKQLQPMQFSVFFEGF